MQKQLKRHPGLMKQGKERDIPTQGRLPHWLPSHRCLGAEALDLRQGSPPGAARACRAPGLVGRAPCAASSQPLSLTASLSSREDDICAHRSITLAMAPFEKGASRTKDGRPRPSPRDATDRPGALPGHRGQTAHTQQAQPALTQCSSATHLTPRAATGHLCSGLLAGFPRSAPGSCMCL